MNNKEIEIPTEFLQKYPADDKNKSNILISVVALSYKSGATVETTLDSILRQTHKRIQLIICDDASDDISIKIIETWLNKHQSRFEGVIFIKQLKNVGTVRNLSSGLASCLGDWIKPIACDDYLEPEALSIFTATALRSGSKWVISQCYTFSEENEGVLRKSGLQVNRKHIPIIRDFNVEAMKSALLLDNVIPAPGVFYSADFPSLCGGLDTRFRIIEDLPMWIRALDAGVRPMWIEEPLVNYRISTQSISQSQIGTTLKAEFINEQIQFYKLYSIPKLGILGHWHTSLQLLRMEATLKHPSNRNILKGITTFLLILSPIAWQRLFRKFCQR